MTFTQKYQLKHSGFQSHCQEGLKDHFSKKRGENVVKSCSNRQLRISEESELTIDPILNLSKPRKVRKFIDRGSGKEGVVSKGGKLVKERFKKSIRRFKVEGFVCVPSLYKYDKEDPKLVRTRSDSSVHYKEYTSFSPRGGCFRDWKNPKSVPKISSQEHRYGILRSEVQNCDKKVSEHLLPSAVLKQRKPEHHLIAESAFRVSKDPYQNSHNTEMKCKPLKILQTSSSGSIDDIMIEQFTRPVRDTPRFEIERTKTRPVTKKTMILQGNKYSKLVESIKQTIAVIKERDLHGKTNVTRELNRLRVGRREHSEEEGLLKMVNAPDHQMKGTNGHGNRKLEPFEYARTTRTKDAKQSIDTLPKNEDMSTCLAQKKGRSTNQRLGISDTSSGSYKTANSVESHKNRSNLSESTDEVECEAREKLTGGRISEGKPRCDKVSDGKKLGSIERNLERTPLRVMNYSFEGHITFPAKSNVREKLKSRSIPPVSRKLSIGIGRAEEVKKDGQYGSNFALKASKSHFDLTTSLPGERRRHGGRRK